MKGDKNKILIIALIAVVVILLGLVLYMLVIKPAITGNVVRLQQQGVVYAVEILMQQAESCQPIPLNNGEKTIYVMAVGCPGTEQIAAAMQQQAQAAQ